ncbi:MAG TPA: LPXTG cell wall anchor domain-containing protein [Actinomycetota bacterium]|nr:LPXTG cell wall anchor domain-containing protein [Actinomycetota bacterium]
MRRRAASTMIVLALAVVLTFALPAAAAPKDLRVSSTSCGSVAVVAEGMPASSQLLLLVRDLADGKVLNTSGKPMAVKSDASGMVSSVVHANLRSVRTVDVSIWTKQGETLTMQAKDTAAANCGSLPMTGSDGTGWELAFAVGLLLVGGTALWLGRRESARATP